MRQPPRVFAEAETTAADKYVVSSINQDGTAPLVTPQAATGGADDPPAIFRRGRPPSVCVVAAQWTDLRRRISSTGVVDDG